MSVKDEEERKESEEEEDFLERLKKEFSRRAGYQKRLEEMFKEETNN